MPQSFPFKLERANLEAPFNPSLKPGHPLRGDEDDTATYVAAPGVAFYRPWLAANDKFTSSVFIWPLGVEGFDLSIKPTLGTHRLIGDNAVYVDVVHKGEEQFAMSGNFPGLSGPANLRALRQLVYMATPLTGKVLYIPHILPYAQRVVISDASFSHTEDERGQDMTYNITFMRTGYVAKPRYNEPNLVEPSRPSTGNERASKRSVVVDGKHNTLRKIALWKLGSASKWNQVYKLNAAWFRNHNVITAKIPDYRLPKGTRIYY